jgi:hypothetical protein
LGAALYHSRPRLFPEPTILSIPELSSEEISWGLIVGSIKVIYEKDILPAKSGLCSDNIGVENIIKLMRLAFPEIPSIKLIGIKTNKFLPCNKELSNELKSNFPAIRQAIIAEILSEEIIERSRKENRTQDVVLGITGKMRKEDENCITNVF